jgi:hypothetical protein
MFALSRNPIFVFLDLYAFGTFLINGTLGFLLFALVLAGGIHYQILQEENFLQRTYGTATDEFAHFLRYVLRYVPVIAMRSIRRNMLTGRRRLHDGVILVLLLLIFADLALPQVCCDEVKCDSGACAAASFVDNGEMDVGADHSNDHRERSSETPNSESGCICCCPHILHSSVQIVDVAAVMRAPLALSIYFLPTSPPKDQFHPPRSA